MRVLVTGNKGYIGVVMCEELLKRGHEVVGLDTDYFEGCDFLPLTYQLKQIKKDVRQVTEKDLVGIDAVIHLAAISNDPMGELNPELTYEINLHGSVNLAKLAKQAGVKRFIFSSSCSAYGVAGEELVNEEGALDPVTAYAKSKVETEKEAAKLADNNFSPVFMRNATVYGVSPRLRLDLVVNNLVGWAYSTNQIKVKSDGSPWRPLMHIKDFTAAFLAVLRAPRELIHNQTFNVGKQGENYQIKDIAELVKRIVPGCQVEFTDEHGADSRTYRVDFGKISKQLGRYFKPSWNVEKGIHELYQAYQQVPLSKTFPDAKFIRLKQLNRLIKKNLVDDHLFLKKGGNND